MEPRSLKDSCYQEIARAAKALASPNRLEIIDYIANGEKSVEDIALQTGITIANASQHLQTLKKERLVVSRKKGVQVYYSLSSIDVYRAWRSIRDLAVSITPFVESLLKENRGLNKYDNPHIWAEIEEGKEVFLLDVRPGDEFANGRIRDAISIPLDKLEERLHEIPKDRFVITYCRGMFCSMADEAVKILRANGYRAKKIEESVLDYQISAL